MTLAITGTGWTYTIVIDMPTRKRLNFHNAIANLLISNYHNDEILITKKTT
jgi:hypothetical protein